MPNGEAITRGLAILAVACYLLKVLLDLGQTHASRSRIGRGIWMLGCIALWVHIAAAFQFVHQWSHAAAVQETARQTGELTGWYWGGGVYFNYAFAVFWLIDVIQSWQRPHPSRLWFWMVHGVFAFMMLNATLVFGPSYWWWIGLAFLPLAAWRVAAVPKHQGASD